MDPASRNGSRGKRRPFPSNSRYMLLITIVSTISFVMLHFYLRDWREKNDLKDRAIIRIFPQDREQIDELKQMALIAKDHNVPDYIEVYGRYDDVLALNRKGIPAAALPERHLQALADSTYPSYDQVISELQKLAAQYGDLMRMEQIGSTQQRKKPLWAVKLSRNVGDIEDEPALLFMGGHHAREPLGMLVCLGIVRHILANAQDTTIGHYLDRMAIWLIPSVNPDGYDYVLSHNRGFPWWRKNMRDNNDNGVFDTDADGVDLNRNYDFNWGKGGRKERRSWYYRGKSPGSEAEIRAVMELAERERFVLAVDYHSFGEVVMFPWALEMRPPDHPLIRDVAANLARRLKKFGSEKNYDIVHLNGQSGQSANWLYATQRTLALIVEVGKEFFPEADKLDRLVADQWVGVEYLLDRVLSSSLVGTIYDDQTQAPLPAMIQFEEDFSPVVSPARCKPDFGRFYRLVLPGRHSITVMMDGYKTVDVPKLLVGHGESVQVNIPMQRLSTLESTN